MSELTAQLAYGGLSFSHLWIDETRIKRLKDHQRLARGGNSGSAMLPPIKIMWASSVVRCASQQHTKASTTVIDGHVV